MDSRAVRTLLLFAVLTSAPIVHSTAIDSSSFDDTTSLDSTDNGRLCINNGHSSRLDGSEGKIIKETRTKSVDNGVRYRIEFETANLTHLRIKAPRSVNSSGFSTQTKIDGSNRLVLDYREYSTHAKDSSHPVWVEFPLTTSANKTEHPSKLPVRGPSRTLTSYPSVTVSYLSNGVEVCSVQLHTLTSNRVETIAEPSDADSDTVATKRYLYHSNHGVSVTTLINDTETVYLVTSADDTLSVKRIKRLFRSGSKRIDAGCLRKTIIFTVPNLRNRQSGSEFKSIGLTHYHNTDEATIWISNTSDPNDYDNIWSHEYVHTRQCFTTDEHMKWIYEGMAVYYETRILLDSRPDSEPIEPRRMYTLRERPNSTLTNESTWAHPAIEYEKGARAYDYLITKLRQHGYTEDTLLTWLNNQDSVVTYESLRSFIVSRTSRTVGRWMDTHIDGPKPIRLGR